MNDNIKLAPKFEFFFTFPFNLGFAIERSQLSNYKYSLQRVANLLNNNFSNYFWSADTFEDNLPLSLKNKCGVIIGKPAISSNIIDIIRQAFTHEEIGATFHDEVEETVVYFDHGVGSVNLTIHATIESLDAIFLFQKLSMRIIDSIRRDEKSLYIFYEWKSFRDAMRKSFSEADVLYDMWGILMTGGEGREPTRYIGENAILYSTDVSQFSVPINDLPKLCSSFTGIKAEDNTNLVPFTSGVIFLAEGWDGQIAVVSAPGRAMWLKNLWQYATDYAAILHDFDRYLYMHTNNLRKESIMLSLGQAKREIEAIHRIQLSMDVITHEILPHNFGGIWEEVQVYRGIYDSWEIKNISGNFKQKHDSLNTMFNNLNARMSTAMQIRLNIIMLIFTVLTLSGVLAGVISATDFDGIYLNPKSRIFIIVFGTISIAFILMIVFSIVRIINRKYRFFRK